MKRLLPLFGAAALAAVLVTSVQAQPAGYAIISSASDPNLVMSPGTYVFTEYYCTNDNHTGEYDILGLPFTNNYPRLGGNNTGNLNTPTFGSDPDDISLWTISEGEVWKTAGFDVTYPTEAGHSYLLELIFHDNFYPSPGSRVFEVQAGPQASPAVLFANLDMAALGAGKADAADVLARCLLINADNNGFRLVLTPGSANNPCISAAAMLDITGVTPAIAGPTAQQYAFVGRNISFNAFVASDTSVNYHWQAGATGSGSYTNLVDAGSISGSLTTNLVITNVTLAQALDYVLVASNSVGSSTSSVVTLNVLAPTATITAGTNYAYAVKTNGVVDYWRLNDPQGAALAYDVGPGGKDGVVGANLQGSFGNAGPEPPDFPSFENNNSGIVCGANNSYDFITTPALNLNTNTVTLLAWLNPNSAQSPGAGLLLARNGAGGPATGLAYGITPQTNGDYSLRYFWNGVSADSGVQVPLNIWSLVGLVVTPSNQTIYVINVNGMLTWTATSSNAVCPFSSPFYIGNDIATNGGQRTFSGYLDEPAVFARALTTSQVLGLFTNASGIASIAASASGPAAYTIVNPGTAASLTGGYGGSPTPTLQWQVRPLGSGSYTNVPGATNATLTFNSVTPANSGDYVLVASNKLGSATSASGRLLVAQSNPPALIGRWLTGTNQNLQDVAGYYPAGLHDGYLEGADAPTWNQGDVPQGFDSSLSSLALDGAVAVAITNTSQSLTPPSGVFVDSDYRLDFDNNITNRFTIAFWAKGFPTASFGPFCTKNGEATHGWQLRHNNQGQGVPTFTVQGIPDVDVGNGSAARYTDSSPAWHHWCGTYDASSGVRHLYMDGVEVLYCAGGVAGMAPPNGYHMILGGKENPGIGNFFTGSLFDVRFYNYAVTPAEVQAMMSPGGSSTAGVYLESTAPAPLDRPVSFTVLIPMGANAAGPVTVWVTNNAPSVATIRGSSGNVFAVTFAQGAPNTQSFILDTIGIGTISLSVGTSAAINTAPFTSANVVMPQMLGQWFTGAQSPADNINYDGVSAHDGAGSAVGTTIGGATIQYTNSVPPGFPAGYSLSLDGTYAVTIKGTSTKGAGYFPTFDANLAHGFSVAYWAIGRPTNWSCWISKGCRTNSQSNLPGWSIRQYNNINIPTFTINETADNAYPDYEGSITRIDGAFANSWHHFVGTWDSGTGLRKLYVDGVLSHWLGNDYGPLPQPAYDYLAIGGEDSCNGTPNNGVTVPTIDNSCFRGAFYDVRVYNYALTASEVPNVMNPNVTTALRAAADTPVIDQGYTGTFSLSLPPGANSGNSVTVWVTNSNPSVVSLAGVGGSVFSLTFPAGAYPTEILTLTGVTDGSSTISVGGGGFTSASATVHVYAANHMTGHWLVGATNLTDYSGFQPAGTHDGTLVGTVPATIWTNDVPPGYPGRSIQFNGGYAIEVNNSAATDAGYQSSFDDVMAHKFTVSFWTKTGDQANWVAWMTKRGDDGIGFQIRRYNSKKEDFALRQTQLHSYTQTASGAVEDMLTTSTKLYDGNWHFVTAIWDGYNGTRQFYVDGSLDPGMNLVGDYATYALARNHHLVIGSEENNQVAAAWGNQNGYLNGIMYDVRVFNYPLTALQMSALMTPPGPPRLTAQSVGGSVQLSWSDAYPGYTVTTKPAVPGGLWLPAGLTINHQTGQYTATDTPGSSPKFYRLMINE